MSDKNGVEKEIDAKIIKMIKEQNGRVLSPLLERFLVLRNWEVDNPPPGYEEFAYAPDAVYDAELIRDLSIEIIKIKQKLGMIEEVQ